MKQLWEEEQGDAQTPKKEEAEQLGFDYSCDFWDSDTTTWPWWRGNTRLTRRSSRYFPMEVVTAGLMDIPENLGLKSSQIEGGEVWHDDVEQCGEVDDAVSGENVGYFTWTLYLKGRQV